MSDLPVIFPHLSEAAYLITSPEDAFYNCIAFAAGDRSQKWWPNDAPCAYWPVHREETIDSFVAAFATLGYETCTTPDLERDYEKVAIYADRTGDPTHMAAQLPSGRWSSKLGDLEDIEHETLDQLNGDGKWDYGRAVRFMRRRRMS
jgi:hypothetical protein